MGKLRTLITKELLPTVSSRTTLAAGHKFIWNGFGMRFLCTAWSVAEYRQILFCGWRRTFFWPSWGLSTDWFALWVHLLGNRWNLQAKTGFDSLAFRLGTKSGNSWVQRTHRRWQELLRPEWSRDFSVKLSWLETCCSTSNRLRAKFRECSFDFLRRCAFWQNL